jgi:hypothetical protein
MSPILPQPKVAKASTDLVKDFGCSISPTFQNSNALTLSFELRGYVPLTQKSNRTCLDLLHRLIFLGLYLLLLVDTVPIYRSLVSSKASIYFDSLCTLILQNQEGAIHLVCPNVV